MSPAFSPFHRGGHGTPLVCLHGFTDTWRSWELILPALEVEHDVLALTLPGHAGGPPLDGRVDEDTIADLLEAAMDEAGFPTAHLVGNSLGGYLALRLAARGRARTVVALAPAGGWVEGDESVTETLRYFATMHELVKQAAPHADQIAATAEGRRRATEAIATHFEHIPAELVAHMIAGAAGCDAALPLIDYATRHGYTLDAERVRCPVRIVWGTADRLLAWPGAAERYRTSWLPHADWVELEGAGHCPQLDVPLETAQLILGFTAGGPAVISQRRRPER
jgi:pimeloyl-ACP methyl ester carboxylesterase